MNLIKHAANKVAFANTLRGFAAFSVLFSHYFGVFWLARSAVVDFTYTPILSQSLHPTPWYVTLLHFSLFDWGAFGVGLFFLISGFVIPFSLQKTNWQGFLVSRFFRIFPTYAAGFSITLFAVWLCTVYFHQPFPLHFKEIFLHFFPSVHDFFRTKNIDGIIWTLEIEIKFYLLCAASIYFFRRNSWKVFLLPILLAFLSFSLNHELVKLTAIGGIKFNLLSVYVFCTPYLIFMFIGTLFHYNYRGILSPANSLFLIVFLFLLFALTIQASIYNASLKHIWSYGFAVLLFSFAFANPALFKGNKFVNFFADISYPLYVVHGISGYVLLTILLDMGCRASIALLIAVGAATLVATLLHKWIESPTQKIGKRLMIKLQNIDTQRQNDIPQEASYS